MVRYRAFLYKSIDIDIWIPPTLQFKYYNFRTCHCIIQKADLNQNENTVIDLNTVLYEAVYQ